MRVFFAILVLFLLAGLIVTVHGAFEMARLYGRVDPSDVYLIALCVTWIGVLLFGIRVLARRKSGAPASRKEG